MINFALEVGRGAIIICTGILGMLRGKQAFDYLNSNTLNEHDSSELRQQLEKTLFDDNASQVEQASVELNFRSERCVSNALQTIMFGYSAYSIVTQNTATPLPYLVGAFATAKLTYEVCQAYPVVDAIQQGLKIKKV